MTTPSEPFHQMTVDECIEVAEKGLDGKLPTTSKGDHPMEGPTRASDVEKRDTRTPAEVRRAEAAKAVATRLARRAALKAAGADLPPSSANLAEDLEQRLRRRTGLQ